MKAVILRGPLDLAIEEIPPPHIGPNDVLLKMKAVGICGTDIHIYKGALKTPVPIILGHEFVGKIVKVGEKVPNLKVGDKAVADHILGCNKCVYCKESKVNLCQNAKALGININGALSEYISIPHHLVYSLPSHLSYDDGVLVEPLSIAWYATKQSNMEKGDTIAVIGQGPIGLLIDIIAQQKGAKVCGLDIDNSRLSHALNNKYADQVINTKKEKVVEKFQKIYQKDGADKVFEVVGIEATASLALQVCQKGGKVIVLGVFHGKTPLDMMDIVKKELTIQGSWTCRDAFGPTIDLLARRKLKIDGFITNRYPFTKAKEAFDDTLKYPKDRIKTIIEF